MASSDSTSNTRSMTRTTSIPNTAPVECTMLPSKAGTPVRYITSHKGAVGTIGIVSFECEDGEISSAWKTYGVHQVDGEEEAHQKNETVEEGNEEGKTDVGVRLTGTDTVDDRCHRLHLGDKDKGSKKAGRNRTPRPIFWTEIVRPAKTSPLLERLTQTLDTDLGGRDRGGSTYCTGTVRTIEAGPFLQSLAHTLDDLGGREQHHKTARPADDTKEEVCDLHPPPTRTFKALIGEQKLLPCNRELRADAREILNSHGHDGVEPDIRVAWMDHMIVQQHLKGTYDTVVLPTPITLEVSSPLLTTASFRKFAYPDGGVPYAYEVTRVLIPTSKSDTIILSASTLDHWSRFILKVSNPLTEFPVSEASTAVVDQSVPTPTPTPIGNQSGGFMKSELRKRDVLDQGDVIEVNPSEASKITSTAQRVAAPTVSSVTIELDEQSGLKPVLHRRNFLSQLEHIEANTVEDSKVTTTINQSPIPSINPTTIQLEQKVVTKPELRRRDWDDDYWDWLDRVERDRDQYLFEERQTLREAYPFQRPGGRTLRNARLRDNSPFRWVLERKRAGRAMPKKINCRLDDMTEAPGHRSSLCDPPPVHSTHPQISAGSTVIPINSTFAVFIALFFFWFLVLPWFRSGHHAANIKLPSKLVYTDNNHHDEDDSDEVENDKNEDYFPPSGDDKAPGGDSRVHTRSALHLRYESQGIEGHLRRLGIQIPDYDGCYVNDRECWEGGDDWL
ncbi:hypothetical protein DL98DRAFT_647823 [Cadophora sp. DSE1049]|nr:hypothetical protein DL98DRAFT_647823 [Cadophora sp. DSE1049]